MNWIRLVCGIPSLLMVVGGLLITGMGILANARQLKLDTNLERRKLILAGLAAAGLGIMLMLITWAIS